ncbi:MAG: (d)CMP kinase [Thermotogota bacterium]
MRIAIDGPAASGKTSLGRALAQQFGCRFIETGKMYRAVALGLVRGLSLDRIVIDVAEPERFLLNGEDVTDLLHTPELDQASSEAGTRPEVRARLVALQRRIATGIDVVMEGRDIGTVVLPDADVKIFLQASPDVRARRRVDQRAGADVGRTLHELLVRDRRDSTRAIAPLNPASDATIIDTDRKTLAEVISEAVNLVKERLLGH